jgi:hypothetical protein
MADPDELVILQQEVTALRAENAALHQQLARYLATGRTARAKPLLL